MSELTELPVLAKGKYRHNKSGKLYQVIAVALDTERDIPMVVYKPLYEHDFGYEVFTRPYQMFIEVVELRGILMPRFEKVED